MCHYMFTKYINTHVKNDVLSSETIYNTITVNCWSKMDSLSISHTTRHTSSDMTVDFLGKPRSPPSELGSRNDMQTAVNTVSYYQRHTLIAYRTCAQPPFCAAIASHFCNESFRPMVRLYRRTKFTRKINIATCCHYPPFNCRATNKILTNCQKSNWQDGVERQHARI